MSHSVFHSERTLIAELASGDDKRSDSAVNCTISKPTRQCFGYVLGSCFKT
jgi:hypothetical protein